MCVCVCGCSSVLPIARCSWSCCVPLRAAHITPPHQSSRLAASSLKALDFSHPNKDTIGCDSSNDHQGAMCKINSLFTKFWNKVVFFIPVLCIIVPTAFINKILQSKRCLSTFHRVPPGGGRNSPSPFCFMLLFINQLDIIM